MSPGPGRIAVTSPLLNLFSTASPPLTLSPAGTEWGGRPSQVAHGGQKKPTPPGGTIIEEVAPPTHPDSTWADPSTWCDSPSSHPGSRSFIHCAAPDAVPPPGSAPFPSLQHLLLPLRCIIGVAPVGLVSGALHYWGWG